MNLEDETRFVQKAWTVERRPLTDVEISTVAEYAKTISPFERVDFCKKFGLCFSASGFKKSFFATKFRAALDVANERRKEGKTMQNEQGTAR